MNIKDLSEQDRLRRTRLIQAIYNNNNHQRTKGEIAQSAGYTPEYLSRILSGERRLTNEAAKHFSKVLYVREDYLLGKDPYMTQDDLEKATFMNTVIGTFVSKISFYHDKRFFSGSFYDFLDELPPFDDPVFCSPDFADFLYKARYKTYYIDFYNEKYVELTNDEYMDFCEEIAHFIKFKIDYLFETKIVMKMPPRDPDKTI